MLIVRAVVVVHVERGNAVAQLDHGVLHVQTHEQQVAGIQAEAKLLAAGNAVERVDIAAGRGDVRAAGRVDLATLGHEHVFKVDRHTVLLRFRNQAGISVDVDLPLLLGIELLLVAQEEGMNDQVAAVHHVAAHNHAPEHRENLVVVFLAVLVIHIAGERRVRLIEGNAQALRIRAQLRHKRLLYASCENIFIIEIFDVFVRHSELFNDLVIEIFRVFVIRAPEILSVLIAYSGFELFDSRGIVALEFFSVFIGDGKSVFIRNRNERIIFAKLILRILLENGGFLTVRDDFLRILRFLYNVGHERLIINEKISVFVKRNVIRLFPIAGVDRQFKYIINLHPAVPCVKPGFFGA